MKKLRYLIAAIILAVAVLPFSVFGAGENTQWKIDSNTGELECNGIKYVPFYTGEYHTAIDELIGEASDQHDADGYRIYGVKNAEDNDLVYLYNFARYRSEASEFEYDYDSFAILYCKENKVDEYTEIIKSFTPSGNYCLHLAYDNCFAKELDGQLVEFINQAPENKEKFNYGFGRKYSDLPKNLCEYDENHLFFAEVGTFYTDFENGEAYFCDYRKMENAPFSYGFEPEYGFNRVATMQKVPDSVWKTLEIMENDLNERSKEISQYVSPEDNSLLVSSASVADILVMAAAVLLLFMLPLFIVIWGIIRLALKNGSKRLWIWLIANASAVIIVSTVIAIIIL